MYGDAITLWYDRNGDANDETYHSNDATEFSQCFIQEIDESSCVHIRLGNEWLIFIGVDGNITYWTMPEHSVMLCLPAEIVDKDFVISKCYLLTTHQAALIAEMHNIYFDEKWNEYEPEFYDIRSNSLC